MPKFRKFVSKDTLPEFLETGINYILGNVSILPIENLKSKVSLQCLSDV
jgi:hypothetical protein